MKVQCQRCGFDGFCDPTQGHVCRVFVSLDEYEALKRDAVRYRWLKEKWSTGHGSFYVDWRFPVGCAEVYGLEPLIDKAMGTK